MSIETPKKKIIIQEDSSSSENSSIPSLELGTTSPKKNTNLKIESMTDSDNEDDNISES